MIKSDEISYQFSCWNRAEDNERVFVLLARDIAAPVAIRAWATERIRIKKNMSTDSQITEALECATLMEALRVSKALIANIGSLPTPDGYALVPIEPTEAMMKAFSLCCDYHTTWKEAWRAVLASVNGDKS